MAWRCRFLTARRGQHGNDLVKNCRVHPTHWLISTQRDTDRGAGDVSRENGEKRNWERDRADEEPDGIEARDGRRRANDFVELLDVREESVARDLAAQEDGVGRGEFCRRAREIVLQEVDALDLGHRCSMNSNRKAAATTVGQQKILSWPQKIR